MAENDANVSLSDFVRNRESMSLIPTLIDTVGRGPTLQIVEVFGGTEIRIPQFKDIVRVFRDFDIWHSLKSGEATQSQMAKKYGLNQGTVSRLYAQIEEEIEDLVRTREL